MRLVSAVALTDSSTPGAVHLHRPPLGGRLREHVSRVAGKDTEAVLRDVGAAGEVEGAQRRQAAQELEAGVADAAEVSQGEHLEVHERPEVAQRRGLDAAAAGEVEAAQATELAQVAHGTAVDALTPLHGSGTGGLRTHRLHARPRAA